MMDLDDFFELGNFIGKMVIEERPLRVLEISGAGGRYGRLLKAVQVYCGIQGGVVDRIVIPGSTLRSGGSIYNKVTGMEILDDPGAIGRYDFVLILDLFEQIEVEKARGLLDALQYIITKQVMIITPLDSGAGFRKYHPVMFLGLDFCYSLLNAADEPMQVYSVFPKTEYEAARLDGIPDADAIKKLKVAFVLPHQNLTGGMKALLQQIRQLTKRGHTVKAYFRSDKSGCAIPAWSELTGEDYAQQLVVPASGRYLDYIEDADVILLGWMFQMPEFLPSKIPVVLWEQGSEAMFGDFGKALHSASENRLVLHKLFRLPVHLLAVSDTNIAALKGIYNRDAFLFPNGVDTAFYHPAEKRNDIPVILLVGYSDLAFKGFHFAFDVLWQTYAAGLRFRVKWASQMPVQHGETNFPLEVIVNPPQPELADIYRNADIFLSASLYESYPLPPLEAMASGTAVIATDCGGIRTYAIHGKNCILCRQGDTTAMTAALARLLGDRNERERLALAGLETAHGHSAEKVIGLLENRLSSIAQYDRQFGMGGMPNQT